MTRAEAAKAYADIGRQLDKLQVDACEWISRQDNNQVFEIAWFFAAVSKRIKKGYPKSDYLRLLK